MSRNPTPDYQFFHFVNTQLLHTPSFSGLHHHSLCLQLGLPFSTSKPPSHRVKCLSDSPSINHNVTFALLKNQTLLRKILPYVHWPRLTIGLFFETFGRVSQSVNNATLMSSGDFCTKLKKKNIFSLNL